MLEQVQRLFAMTSVSLVSDEGPPMAPQVRPPDRSPSNPTTPRDAYAFVVGTIAAARRYQRRWSFSSTMSRSTGLRALARATS